MVKSLVVNPYPTKHPSATVLKTFGQTAESRSSDQLLTPTALANHPDIPLASFLHVSPDTKKKKPQKKFLLSIVFVVKPSLLFLNFLLLLLLLLSALALLGCEQFTLKDHFLL